MGKKEEETHGKNIYLRLPQNRVWDCQVGWFNCLNAMDPLVKN